MTDALVIERAVVPVLVKRTVAVSWEFHDVDGPGFEPIRDITSRSLNGLPSTLRATKVSAFALLTTTTVSFHSPLVLVGLPRKSSKATTQVLATVAPAAVLNG